MSKKLLYTIIGIVIVIILVVGGYFIITNQPASAPVGSGNNKVNTPNTVNIQNFAFNPETVTVNKGDTVTWTNNDSATHHIVADDGSFDLGNQTNGSTVKQKFDASGTFSYHCSIHPTMVGKVIVK